MDGGDHNGGPSWRDVERKIDSARAEKSAKKPGSGLANEFVRLELQSAADVIMRPVRFLWPGRVVQSEINLLFGPGKRGKGQTAAAITAHVSGGPTLPGAPTPEPGRVVWMGAEDSIDRVVVPRLRAADAKLANVQFLKAKFVKRSKDGGEEYDCFAQLARDAAVIAKAVTGARLFVIDPLAAFIDSEIDAHRDNEVRQVMGALQNLAERTGVTILAIAHANKRGDGGVNQRLGGSVGIYNAARQVLVVERHPDQPDTNVLAAADGNLGPRTASLEFKFEGLEVREPTTNEMIPTSRVVYGAECSLTADELLSARPTAKTRRATKAEVGDARDAIMELLATEKRGFTDAELAEKLKELGHEPPAVASASKELFRSKQVSSYRAGGAWGIQPLGGNLRPVPPPPDDEAPF